MIAPSWQQASDELHRRVQHWIGSVDLAGPTGDARAAAEALALDLAAFQSGHIDALARLWKARGTTRDDLRSWADIPALSCDVFRLRRVAVHPAETDARRFRTSGTSQGTAARGEHALRRTDTYEAGALRWGAHMLWPDRDDLALIALVPSEEEAPDSSLTFMIARFGDALGGPASWHVRQGSLDIDSVAHRCSEARRQGRPVLVAGTSLAFAELCDELDPRSLALPAGSRLMHTGGFKGRAREVDAAKLRDRIAVLFHVPPSHVVGEYGMTELSSQLYEGSLRRALGRGCEAAAPCCFYPPPWMRVRAVAQQPPVQAHAEEDGMYGMCQVLDLANVDSAVSVLTGDRIRMRPDGSIELRGRAAGAPPRGCSLER